MARGESAPVVRLTAILSNPLRLLGVLTGRPRYVILTGLKLLTVETIEVAQGP